MNIKRAGKAGALNDMFEVGRICMKVAGREAGKYCVIVKKMDGNFVMVTGPREITSVKRRKCSIGHLEPIMEKVKISQDAADSEILKAYEQAGLFEKLKIERPTEEQIRQTAERSAQREARKAEIKPAERPKEKEEKKNEKKEKPKAGKEKDEKEGH